MTTPASASPTTKSKLVPIGVLFLIVGIFGRQPLVKLVTAMQPGSSRGLLYAVATDGLTLLFVAGATCVLIGWLRNRKALRASQD